jgi:S-(hydroxymethyl)glutathione dehydrogenase / alcohol dehydrogenase
MAGGTLIDGQTGMSLNGETVYRGTATGALSEHLVVAERVALPLRDDVPVEDAALLGCAALTGVGAVLFAARVEPGATVFVVGAGGVGQFVLQGARLAGAGVSVSVDPAAPRREQAVQVGAAAAVPPEEVKEAMGELLPDGADYAFDAVGEPETTKLAMRWTKNGGTCVVVGLPSGAERLQIDPAEFYRREKHLTGTIYGSEDPAVSLPILLDHVRSGRLDLGEMLGPVFPLERVNDAIEASLGGSGGRVVVRP